MENTLRLISGLILIAALLGLSAMMVASIRQRRYEIHLLRVIGAPPSFLFLLIEMEALLISLLSILLSISALYLSLVSSSGFLASQFGLLLALTIIRE